MMQFFYFILFRMAEGLNKNLTFMLIKMVDKTIVTVAFLVLKINT